MYLSSIRSLMSKCLIASVAVSVVSGLAAATDSRIEFNRDIRPLLSQNCLPCHGHDKNTRKADLRLDLREDSILEKDGRRPIVPGDSTSSELIRRIYTLDSDDRMPPEDSGKELSEPEKELLKAWIDQGAEYQSHWSFIPPVQSLLPDVGDAAWPANPIDYFILNRLDEEGLMPAAEADERRLIRRLYLDVIGLPPTVEEVDRFIEAGGNDAYVNKVDELLSSTAFGERLAVFWLDLVRYADTVGYHGDQPFSVYPFRDYVIEAFNSNKPFDEFTREQLAGDLLPNAGPVQQVASGYNRLNMITAEGGAQDKEYLVKYAADRVRTTGSTWIASTLGCAECHDHKFDPFTTRDFYSFGAYFADLKEKGFYGGAHSTGKWGPSIPVPNSRQKKRLARLNAGVKALKERFSDTPPELVAAQREWETRAIVSPSPKLGNWYSVGPFAAESFDQAHEQAFGPEKGVDLEQTFQDGKLKWVEKPDWVDSQIQTLKGENSATYLFRTIESESEQALPISLGSDDSIQVWLNGESVLSKKISRGVAPDQDRISLPLDKGSHQLLMKITNGGGGYGFYFGVKDSLPENISAALAVKGQDRTSEELETINRYFRSITPLLEDLRKDISLAQNATMEFEKNLPTMLVSLSVDPREMRVLNRGNWMDESGPIVQPSVPEFLKINQKSQRRQTRLDLAEWLVSRENPLTARTFVNRLWKIFYGSGLAPNLDDLGSQGDWPTHPRLLDWLAVEFMESGWNIKRLVRLLVTSSTYRQDSTASKSLVDRDPLNRLYGRQSRFRLEAELVRDNALKISGLLVEKVGGRSVKPYQPKGYYAQLNFPKRVYQPDTGEDQYRRGVYSHWQRTFLHPSMSAFDAPNREECTADRPKSNTPLQALVLLNDPSHVEGARVLSEKILRMKMETLDERLDYAFTTATARRAGPKEREILRALHARHLEQFQVDSQAAGQLVGVGYSPSSASFDTAELAAMTSVCRAILNLQETISRY